MVARTKLSPSLLIDESNRRNRNEQPKTQQSPSNLHRKNSFSELSSISQSESFDSLSSSPRAVAPAPCAARLRSRFLNRLGITSPTTSLECPTRSPTAAKARRPRPLSRDWQDESFHVSLTGDDDEGSKASDMSFGLLIRSSSLSSSTGSQSASEKSVSFAPAVTVHPIPKHTAYSSRIRETIWTNPTEMQELAARNCLEFASENWDWRQVAEDQDMVHYQGELVHPVHFAHEYNIRRQFCAVMSAQQHHQR